MFTTRFKENPPADAERREPATPQGRRDGSTRAKEDIKREGMLNYATKMGALHELLRVGLTGNPSHTTGGNSSEKAATQSKKRVEENAKRAADLLAEQ
eukprot:1250439-Prymnesium_polylepis.1